MRELANAAAQRAALAELHALLRRDGIAYWLLGGWAVDFHAGRVSRAHADLDVAVWARDGARLAALLAAGAWVHAPEGDEDGYTGYVRGGVRLEVAFLARDDHGRVYTPIRDGQAEWPDDAFGDEVAELLGVQARVIRRRALIAEKSGARADPVATATDRADVLTLTRAP